jgi:ABC-type antimicrobial peptide transport system permease subunit
LLTSVLYQTRPNDPILIVLDGALVAAVALCAGYLAVRRISRIEPMAVLRRD